MVQWKCWTTVGLTAQGFFRADNFWVEFFAFLSTQEELEIVARETSENLFSLKSIKYK